MLGLIAAWIATFVPMIVIFLDVARNPPLAVFARLVVGSLAVVLLAADVSLTLAILSKFQEIVILERELGVTRFYNGIRQYRFAGKQPCGIRSSGAAGLASKKKRLSDTITAE